MKAIPETTRENRQIFPTPTVSFLGGAEECELNYELLISQARNGNRGAWFRLYSVSSKCLAEGFALPDPLQAFIAERLRLIADLLGSGDDVDNAWRNKLAEAVKGTRLNRRDARRYNKERAQLDHQMNKISGLLAKDSYKQIAADLKISEASAKRLCAPSATKRSRKVQPAS